MSEQKTCSKCSNRFLATQDYFQPLKKKGKVWLSAECRECRRLRFRKYYSENREGIVRRSVEWVKLQRLSSEERRESERLWARESKRRKLADPAMRADHNERGRNWRKNNPDYRNRFKHESPERKAARTMARYARKRCAMPPWVDDETIASVYEKARATTLSTGVLHEVDHIFPLAGKSSCGLHVPWNLRVIPALENRSKGNRLPLPEEIEEIP
ncbi:hypothetical protein V5F77_02435 [Xanthobacter sp. DSM 24535]|uniref:hypothetical protein n=1 Tax=Roseixanthobacter psychrophilus TaxID=3119917 RepID=UPI0037285FD4